jgi:D-alanyl-D-alanine carboxypeptidase
VALLLTAALLGSCDSRDDAPLADRLQAVLDAGIRRSDEARGVSAAVVYPDGEVWTGTSGFSHDQVEIRPDMLFAIGSITKNTVAALTLRLAEDGLLTLEDPLSTWLPNYPHVDSGITIRQLLNHTSGVYNIWDSDAAWEALNADRAKAWAPEEVLGFLEDPYFAPGEGWRYSNTNYLLAAMIVTRATRSTLSSALQRYFWQPLGIEDAYLMVEEPLPDRLAHVYGDDFQFGDRDQDVTFEPRVAHDSMTWGSGGLFMTTEALARWSQALFGGKVLSRQSLDQMLDFVEISPIANMRAYGLGVQEYERRFSDGEVAIGHGGANIGTATYMVYLPDQCTSLAVSVNAFPTEAIDHITRKLLRTLLRDF